MQTPHTSPPTVARIGVFDSGVGGLSVLRALRQALPNAAFHYVADSAHAPYGERSDAHVLTRSQQVAAYLHHQGARMLVVACNTATAVAIQALRERWPGMPIVGVEPGIKPALAATRQGQIGVMATRATLASERFARLLQTQQGNLPVQVHLQACDGLASAIERGDLDADDLRALIHQHCQALRSKGVDTVVLGCTHYPFVAHHIQAALGREVQLIDTAQAVARQAARLWSAVQVAHVEPHTLQLQTTGDAQEFARIATRWLELDGAAAHISLAPV